jgi:hypothetical protein
MRIRHGEIPGLIISYHFKIIGPLPSRSSSRTLEHHVSRISGNLYPSSQPHIVHSRTDIKALIKQYDSSNNSILRSNQSKVSFLHKQPTISPLSTHIRTQETTADATASMQAAQQITARLSGVCRASPLFQLSFLALFSQG